MILKAPVMYNKQSFSKPFTVPLRGITNTAMELSGSPQAQIVIFLQKEDDTPENKVFIEKFIKAIPFRNDETEIALSYVDHPPSWKQIQSAFPQFYLLLCIGFPFSELQLQFPSSPYLLFKFKSHFLMQVPTLDVWKENKKAKMQIWNELKTIPLLPKS